MLVPLILHSKRLDAAAQLARWRRPTADRPIFPSNTGCSEHLHEQQHHRSIKSTDVQVLKGWIDGPEPMAKHNISVASVAQVDGYVCALNIPSPSSWLRTHTTYCEGDKQHKQLLCTCQFEFYGSSQNREFHRLNRDIVCHLVWYGMAGIDWH